MKKKVLVTGNSVDERFIRELRNNGLEVSNPQHFLEEDELIKSLKNVEYYLCGGDEKATERVLRESGDLRLYAFLGVGYGGFIDEDAATREGIAITSTPGTLTTTVAEFTIGMLLAANRQLVALNNSAKKGKNELEKLRDLDGQTVGIIGMGDIGGCVAQKLQQCFNMAVLYHNRKPRMDLPASVSAEYVSLEELLPRSDVIMLTLTGVQSNYGIIGESQFNLMKDGVILVNTARANLVDPDGLKRALDTGKVRIAAFDGYFEEPIPAPKDDKFGLLSYPDSQFIITPHIASLTHNARDRMSEKSINSILSFDKRGDDRYIVNPAFRKNIPR